MQSELQKTVMPKNKRTVVPVILILFIVIMLIATAILSFLTLQNENIYKGVTVGSLDASGMDPQELVKSLDAGYQSVLDDMSVTLKTDKHEEKMRYNDLGVKYDTETAVNEAYNVGRSGNIFKRLYAIARSSINGITINVPIIYDDAKVESFVNDFYSVTLRDMSPGAILITDSSVKLKSGHHGEEIDKQLTVDSVKALINEHKSGTIEPDVTITPYTEFDAEELYGQIVCDPVDAAYKMVDGKLTLIPHTSGRGIDKSTLSSIVDELNKHEDEEKTLNITFTEPAVTSDKASSNLFKDVLASSSSYFGTGTQNGKNRKANMELAASKIDNLILVPGEEFSYNKVVGPRDIEHGYQLAHVFSGGKVIDGVGGGICQVSSTMYVAVLKADLKVTERKNHSFIVGYVPLGQDATAYYGGTDFRFVNSTNWPIQLSVKVSGNRVNFSIKGTNEHPEKAVIISNKVLSETPFEIRYTDDPTLPVGTTKVMQEGSKGYVVETYKTIKMNGKVISQSLVNKSTYKACNEEIFKGTKATGSGNTQQSTTPSTVETVVPEDIIDAPAVEEQGSTTDPSAPAESVGTSEPSQTAQPDMSDTSIEPDTAE